MRWAKRAAGTMQTTAPAKWEKAFNVGIIPVEIRADVALKFVDVIDKKMRLVIESPRAAFAFSNSLFSWVYTLTPR